MIISIGDTAVSFMLFAANISACSKVAFIPAGSLRRRNYAEDAHAHRSVTLSFRDDEWQPVRSSFIRPPLLSALRVGSLASSCLEGTLDESSLSV